ncbi:MAG TPA: hypothetical protein VKI65_20700 [Gemmataceae bacterium]|nr:hypothetical protein [Gemmataceae bacterium]
MAEPGIPTERHEKRATIEQINGKLIFAHPHLDGLGLKIIR